MYWRVLDLVERIQSRVGDLSNLRPRSHSSVAPCRPVIWNDADDPDQGSGSEFRLTRRCTGRAKGGRAGEREGR